MKALHLISGRMMGGGQQVALDLAAGLRRRAGAAAEVGLLGCSFLRLRAAAAFVIPYDGNYASLASLAATAWRLRAVLRERRYDLVHTHGWDADVIGRWALGDRPEPQLVHLHVTPGWVHSGSFKHRVRRAMTRRLFSSQDVAIVAVAQAVKDHWGGAFAAAAGRTRVVHNGVDTERFRPLCDGRGRPANGPLVIGAACRLMPQKGLLTLIEAMPAVIASAGRPVRLAIAGEGPQCALLEERIVAFGLGRQVRLLGQQQDMPGFYRSLDLFALASECEGLPLTVLEAMATAVPVVATDVGGTGEAVRDGIDGRLVPLGDTEALSAALTELVTDDERRRSMGAGARLRCCRGFSLDAQIDRTAALYRELLGNLRRERPLAA